MSREAAARAVVTLALLLGCALLWAPLGWLTAQHEWAQVLDPALRPLLLLAALGLAQPVLSRLAG